MTTCPAVDSYGFALPGGGAPAVITPAPPPPRHRLLDELDRVLAALAGLDPAERSPEALTVDLIEAEILLRRHSAINARWLAHFDEGCYAHLVLGLTSTRQFLTSYLRVGRQAIGRRLRAARAVFQQRDTSVEAKAQALALTQELWLTGELEDGHVAVIADTHAPFVADLTQQGLSDDEVLARAEGAERAMVEASLTMDPERLRKETQHIREQFLPEAVPTKEAILWRDRWLKLSPMANGHTKVTGALMPETAQLLKRALERHSDHRGDGDDRMPSQVAHDALTELALAALAPPVLTSPMLTSPVSAGSAAAADKGSVAGALVPGDASAATACGSGAPAPVPLPSLAQSLSHLSVVISHDVLMRLRNGSARLLDGGYFDAESAIKLSCDSDFSRALVRAGRIVDDSRSRSAVGNLRRRILLRDHGRCRHPGCDRPARHIHHLVEYARGGRTTSSNLASLCHFHHNLIHHDGWILLGNPDVEDLVAVAPARDSLPQRVHKSRFGDGAGYHEHREHLARVTALEAERAGWDLTRTE